MSQMFYVHFQSFPIENSRQGGKLYLLELQTFYDWDLFGD